MYEIHVSTRSPSNGEWFNPETYQRAGKFIIIRKSQMMTSSMSIWKPKRITAQYYYHKKRESLSSKSPVFMLFTSWSSFVISFLKRQEALKATEAFWIFPVTSTNLHLRNSAGYFVFMCARINRPDIPRHIDHTTKRSQKSLTYLGSCRHLHCIFMLA